MTYDHEYITEFILGTVIEEIKMARCRWYNQGK